MLDMFKAPEGTSLDEVQMSRIASRALGRLAGENGEEPLAPKSRAALKRKPVERGAVRPKRKAAGDDVAVAEPPTVAPTEEGITAAIQYAYDNREREIRRVEVQLPADHGEGLPPQHIPDEQLRAAETLRPLIRELVEHPNVAGSAEKVIAAAMAIGAAGNKIAVHVGNRTYRHLGDDDDRRVEDLDEVVSDALDHFGHIRHPWHHHAGHHHKH
jgi:hypothetical protein